MEKSKYVFEKIGYVYVIEDKERGICKIGRSKKWNTRVNGILTGSGIKECNVYVSPKVGDCNKLELQAHNFFDASRVNGEWFSISMNEAISYIKDHAVPITENEEREAEEYSNFKSKVFLDGMKSTLGIKSELGGFCHSWAFIKDCEPTKEHGQIVVDIYPLTLSHQFEIARFIDDKNAFYFKFDGKDYRADIENILCWMYVPKPIIGEYQFVWSGIMRKMHIAQNVLEMNGFSGKCRARALNEMYKQETGVSLISELKSSVVDFDIECQDEIPTPEQVEKMLISSGYKLW